MPRGDGTGPAGTGPMSGRGAGYCAGWAMPGFMNPEIRPRYGCNFGKGAGRGYRNMYFQTGVPGWARTGTPQYGPALGPMGTGRVGPYSPIYSEPTAEEEKIWLGKQEEVLKKQLEQIRQRLNSLKEEKGE